MSGYVRGGEVGNGQQVRSSGGCQGWRTPAPFIALPPNASQHPSSGS